MQKNRLFLIFSAIFIFLLFFLPPLDTDLGWHLRYGQYFVNTLHFLRNNTLTYYLSGYFWQNSYTFYQVFMYLIYKSFGLFGLNIAYSVLMAFSYYFLTQIHPRFEKISFFLFLFIAVFSWSVFNLGLRSQLFSFLFVTIIVYLLEKSESNPKHLYWLPPIFLVWANFHGAFPLGLFIFLMYLINKILLKEKNVYKTSIVLFISTLTTLVNPYGLGVYKEAFTHATYPLRSLIAEWVPPNLVYILIIVAIFTFTLISTLLSNSKKKFFIVTLISFFTILSVMARRNLPYIALIFSISLLYIFKDKLAKFENSPKFTEFSVICLIVGFLYVLTIRLPGSHIASINSESYCNNSFRPYPCNAILFLKEKNVKNMNIFANYEWGGYLEWVLPDNKYFVDGRMPTWKTPENLSPYTVFLNVIQAQPGYEKTLDIYRTDKLLISQGSYLDLELSSNKSIWKEIYRDDIAVIYSKK